MDQFYEDLMLPLMYRWLAGWNCLEVCEDHYTLCIENETQLGIIRFYQNIW